MATQESSDLALKCATAKPSSDEEGAAVATPAAASATAPFKFNVHAPEFVPMSPAAASPIASPMSAPAGGYYSPFMQMQPGLTPDHWSFFHEHEPVFFMPDFAHAKFGAAATAAAAAAGSNSAQTKGTGGATDVAQKIVKQVVDRLITFCYVISMVVKFKSNTYIIKQVAI